MIIIEKNILQLSIMLTVLLFFSFCEDSKSTECIDVNACAEADDGSCIYPGDVGTEFENFCNCEGDTLDCDLWCGGIRQTDDCGECEIPDGSKWNDCFVGCTDSSAANYDSSAIFDDGNCIESFPDGWTLVWNDEFEGDNIDEGNWTHEIWPPGQFNEELQAYTDHPENSYLKDGHLVIRALRESYDGAQYTSARLVSSGKAEFQYGRFDIRAKVPLGQGTWPAIWMLGSNHSVEGWPACGEIDIMEHINLENSIHSSIHTTSCYFSMDGYPGDCPDYSLTCPNGCSGALGPNTYWTYSSNIDDWHVYGMIWTEDNIVFTVDDEPYMTVYRPISSGESSWPFDQEFFFILNMAIGGDWPGNPDDNIFPITFEIDYVRVYESIN